MNNKTPIYMLTASAFVILALVIVKLENRFTAEAQAATVTSNEQSTEFTAKIRSNEDGFFHINNSTGRLLLYVYDDDIKRVKFHANLDLRRVFKTEPKPKADKSERERKRARDR